MTKTTRINSWVMAIGVMALPLLLAMPAPVRAQALWIEGKHYEVIRPAVPTSTPGKVEVVEVFSYGCPYCYQAEPMMQAIAAKLPAKAKLVRVAASFLAGEAWPMFQRAYYTAQSLGIADKTHAAMFEAIWVTGELPLMDPATKRLMKPLPTIADAARFYAHHAAVTQGDFIKASQSFAVETNMRRADELVKAYAIPGTPAIVINGKYRIGPNPPASEEQMNALIHFLIGLESRQVPKKAS